MQLILYTLNKYKIQIKKKKLTCFKSNKILLLTTISKYITLNY